MRRSASSWTTVLAQLGFRRRKKRKETRGRLSRFEPLEERRLLTTSSESLSPEITDGWRETLAIAPENYSAGHFTLVTDDWSGKSTAGRMLATGISLGIDSGQLGNDPSGFDPGESWSFRFETSGQLMGLHFDDFTVDDADKALLFIGDAEPCGRRQGGLLAAGADGGVRGGRNVAPGCSRAND